MKGCIIEISMQPEMLIMLLRANNIASKTISPMRTNESCVTNYVANNLLCVTPATHGENVAETSTVEVT